MTSIKCPQCGLVYWTTVANCKRCGLATADGQENQVMDQPQSNAGPAPVKSFPSSSFDEDQLLRNLKRDSYRFYFIGGLQTIAWLVIGNLLIVDAVLNIGLSFLAQKFKSRIAATALLLLTVLSVLVGLLTIAIGAMSFNPFIPLVLLGRLAVSIRMVYTTFKLKAQVSVDVTRMMPPLPPVFHEQEGPQWAQPAGSPQWQPE
jgi:hypothetical protein